MTTKEKVGQLFVIEVFGREADKADPKNHENYGVYTPAQVIDKYKPGGIIYFGKSRSDNLGDLRQIATLSNALQTAALRQHTPIPLLICTDQEGGSVVSRLPAPATAMPGNMALGATRSAADARRSAEVIGKELAALGINQNLAPVADVNVNPINPVIGVRSVGERPDLVSELVAAQVRGYRDGGVTMVAKHFPGHGNTTKDTHVAVAEVPHNREQLHAIDLPPFRAALGEGIDTIMTAHVALKAIDPSGVPATMSRTILTGLLRGELGFDGLIITDGLDMRAATTAFPPRVAPVTAIKAGADQLLLPPLRTMDDAFDAVVDAVESGEISLRRLDESVYRILWLKMKRGLFDNSLVDVDAAAAIVGAPGHLTDAQAITERSTTLVINDARRLPLSPLPPRKMLVTGWIDGTTKTIPASTLTAIRDAVGRRGYAVEVVETGPKPEQSKIDQAVARAALNDLVVVPTCNTTALAPNGEPAVEAVRQQELVKALLATGKPVIVAAMRNPYDISTFPEVTTYLATYGFTDPSAEALVRVLFGEIQPVGKLPVTVAQYGFGHGLTFSA